MRITVELDLTTCAGRAAMRAWLDATETPRREARLEDPEMQRVLDWYMNAHRELQDPAPAEPVGQGADDGVENPAPAPLDPDPPAPPPDPAPVDTADLAGLDPKRPWTDPERARAELMAAEGFKPAAIASKLARDRIQIANYLVNVKAGRVASRLPNPPAALMPTSAATHEGEDDYRRPPVRRAEVVEAGRERLAQAAAERQIREALYARPA